MELNKIYKSVLITGGAQRIGESIASFLANSGLNVAIQFNKSEKKALELKKKFDKKKKNFPYIGLTLKIRKIFPNSTTT